MTQPQRSGLSPTPPPAERTPGGGWTFLTNHALVLLCLAEDHDVRLRDVADSVGITERAVQHIVADLEAAGFLTRQREGRRNRYALHLERPMRHPLNRHHTVGDLLRLVRPIAEFSSMPGNPPSAGPAPSGVSDPADETPSHGVAANGRG